MAVQVSYPGVYIQEIPSGVRTITGVSTSIPLFIGRTERGIQKKPTRIFSFLDYVRNFGAGTQQSEMAHQVRQFFNNGGTQAYVMRIAHDAKEASVELKNESGEVVLIATAKEAGLSGSQLRIDIDYDTPTPDKTFNLRVFRHTDDGVGGFLETEQERFVNLSMNTHDPLYAVNFVTKTSKLLSLEEPSTPRPRINGILLGGHFIGIDDSSGETITLDKIINDNSKNLLRIKVAENGTFEEIDLSGATNPDGIADSINTYFGEDVVTVTTAPDAGMRLLKITNFNDEDIEIGNASDSTRDFAQVMQLGVINGGIEIGADSSRRPSPSGMFYEYDGEEFENLIAIARLQQNEITEVSIQEHTISDIKLFNSTESETERMSQGDVTQNESLLNVQEKLLRFTRQFNEKANALPNFDWIASVQGMQLIFKSVQGSANAGLNSEITTSPSNELVSNIKTDNTRLYSLGIHGGGGYQSDGFNGKDGDPPNLQDYNAAFEIAKNTIDIFNLLVLPRDNENIKQRLKVWSKASIFAEQQRAFLIVDPPLGWQSIQDVFDEPDENLAILRQGLVKDHAAVYWPRISIIDPATDLLVTIDPCGTIAGLMARTDANRGVWKAPAGIEASLNAVRGVEHDISDRENGVINPQAVNAIRVFPNGIVSWGARTMDGFDNSGNDDYKYVPVRRFALFIEESLYRGLKWAVFEPNDEPLWAQIRLAAGAFMNNLFRQGAFQGQKTSDAYFVKCDAETTTQNDINLGIVNVLVGFAPLKPAEFVVITIQQIAGQVQT